MKLFYHTRQANFYWINFIWKLLLTTDKHFSDRHWKFLLEADQSWNFSNHKFFLILDKRNLLKQVISLFCTTGTLQPNLAVDRYVWFAKDDGYVSKRFLKSNFLNILNFLFHPCSGTEMFIVVLFGGAFKVEWPCTLRSICLF